MVDGYTQKIFAMFAFGSRPASEHLSALIGESIEQSGAGPRFLITDHGSQFRSRIHGSIGAIGVTHIRCHVRTWQLNAKVERLF